MATAKMSKANLKEVFATMMHNPCIKQCFPFGREALLVEEEEEEEEEAAGNK